MRKKWIALISVLSCACSALGCSVRPQEETVICYDTRQGTADGEREGQPEDTALTGQLTAAVYPEMAPYPDERSYIDEKTGEFDDEGFQVVYDAWREDLSAQLDQPEGYADGLEPFFRRSIAEFLGGAGKENRVYSPLNVYMALGMLAEISDGESRGQILECLGAEDIEALRAQAVSVWNANYCDDGAVTSILASSLWMNQDVNFKADTLERLAEYYYASAFQGEMGSAAFNEALQSWLNQQTGGLLAEEAGSLEMSPETILALATTIYYRAKWVSEFWETSTETGIFHAASGDAECDFMHQDGTDHYYWGDKFAAVAQPLEGSGAMWFLLPDEGCTPEDLLADAEATEFLLANGKWENQKFLVVNKSIPKFDVVSDLNLLEGLQNLGIRDVFDFDTSDFSPLTDDTREMAITSAQHAARVTIDEEGVTATAYTAMMAAGAAMPPDEEVDFVLDRPFLFCITGTDGLPLFVGVVNQPE